ncbi:MAG: BrnT family toxin [Dehalococcoidia bacterium]
MWGGDFVWDDDSDASGNVVHVWEHGVTPTEAEEAILDPGVTPAEERRIGRERRYTIVGATAAGRILLVVFTMREDAIRVITAYPAKEREKRRYRRRR